MATKKSNFIKYKFWDAAGGTVEMEGGVVDAISILFSALTTPQVEKLQVALAARLAKRAEVPVKDRIGLT